MIISSQLNQTIRFLMKQQGNLTPTELAKRANLPLPTLYKILSGDTEHPHKRSLAAIASSLLVNVDQLLGREPLPNTKEFTPTKKVFLAPMLSWNEISSWQTVLQQQQNNQNFLYLNILDSNITANTPIFAVRMKDSCMQPIFPKGTLLIINPETKPKDRSFVLIKFANRKETLCKQVLFEGCHIYARSLDKNLALLTSQKLVTDDIFIGVVIQSIVNWVE